MSTQELIKLNNKKFKVDTIVANNDVKGLIKAAKYLKPNLVIINNDKMFLSLKKSLEDYNLKIDDEGTKITYIYDAKANRTGITRLLTELKKNNIQLKDITTEQSSLESIFLNLLRKS